MESVWLLQESCTPKQKQWVKFSNLKIIAGQILGYTVAYHIHFNTDNTNLPTLKRYNTNSNKINRNLKFYSKNNVKVG